MRKYAGTWTAIITPFKEDGSLDEAAFRKLIQRQIEKQSTSFFFFDNYFYFKYFYN